MKSKKQVLFLSVLMSGSSFASSEAIESCKKNFEKSKSRSNIVSLLGFYDEQGQLTYNRDVSFYHGEDYNQFLSEKKVSELCKKQMFRDFHKSILTCTEQLYKQGSFWQNQIKVSSEEQIVYASNTLPVSKLTVFNFCQNNHQNPEVDLHKISQCLVNVKDSIAYDHVNGNLSVMSMERFSDDVFKLCQNTQFQLTFSKKDDLSIKTCFQEKMKAPKLNNVLKLKPMYKELFTSMFLPNFKKQADEVSTNYFKTGERFGLESVIQWQDKGIVYNDFIAPAILTYDSCANDFVNGRELHAYYGKAKFVTCLHTKGDDEHITAREIHCGKQFNVPEYKKTILNRAIASELQEPQPYSWGTGKKSEHGEWQNPFFSLSK